jgi:AraC-like DNA-binding protein/quercetin dioxygenase-like cupin family protein
MDNMLKLMSDLQIMESIEKWNLEKGVFRNSPDKPIDESISCGFISKCGYKKDVINEQYNRLAMVYVLRGQGHYSDSLNISHKLQAGDVFFRYPDRVHSTSIDPDSQWLECFVSLRSEWYLLLKSIELIPTDKTCFQIGDRAELPQRIFNCMQQLEDSDSPWVNSNVEFEIFTLMRRVLAQQLFLPKNKSPHRDQLEAARSLIRQHATSPDQLKDILQGIGISYPCLRNLFSKTYGISLGNYRIKVRIEQACALLETSSKSIQEIADLLGYADAFSFSKQFKQRIGVAPKLFRGRQRAPR